MTFGGAGCVSFVDVMKVVREDDFSCWRSSG